MPDFIYRDISQLSAFRRQWLSGKLVVVVHQPMAALVATCGHYDEDVANAIRDSAGIIRPTGEPSEINFEEFSHEDYREIDKADRRLWPRGDGLITEIRRLRARGVVEGLAAVGFGAHGMRVWQSGSTPRAHEILTAAARSDMWSGVRDVRWFRAEPVGGWPELRPEPRLFATG